MHTMCVSNRSRKLQKCDKTHDVEVCPWSETRPCQKPHTYPHTALEQMILTIGDVERIGDAKTGVTGVQAIVCRCKRCKVESLQLIDLFLVQSVVAVRRYD